MVQKHATSGTQEKGEGKGNSQIYIDLQRVMLVKERKRHRGGGRGDRGVTQMRTMGPGCRCSLREFASRG